MKTLFLKIFVWFWLAMAVVGSALLIAVAVTQSDPVEARWRYMTGTAVRVYAQTAAEMYEREGTDALVIYLERVERASRMRATLFDERGVEMSRQVAPEDTKRLAALARSTSDGDNTLFDFPTRPAPVTLIAQRVYGPNGATYVLVSEVHRTDHADLLADVSALVFRLGAVLLTAGLVCYALARYLAAPVEMLRASVRRLASGDLSARVGAKIGARRDEFTDLSRDFDRMAERIESLVASQRCLLGDISHELRSPLARLSVALGLARRHAATEAPNVNSSLDRIERESERLNELIGQLLALTRLETDEDELENTQIDLQDLIAQVVADANFEAQGRHRSVQTVATEKCPVMGNVELLRSAIENVVRNGVRYTAENTSVEVALRCSSDDGGSNAVITVRDHGKGVPEEALGELFRPFYRMADARDRQTGGTGLGLAITERAVRLHGGSVKAANADLGGLIVEIQLPAATIR